MTETNVLIFSYFSSLNSEASDVATEAEEIDFDGEFSGTGDDSTAGRLVLGGTTDPANESQIEDVGQEAQSGNSAKGTKGNSTSDRS